jgi:hypothetical protein
MSKYMVRYRILRDGVTIQLSDYEPKTMAGIHAKYRKIARGLHGVFRFRIETEDESVIWIGWGSDD